LPVDAAGELDSRYYQAQMADLRSATAESREQKREALTAIRRALDLYSQMAREAPDDPGRLFDAAKARFNYARLLGRNGRPEAAGDEALKSLGQLDRLAAWPGFKADSLPSLRCSALRLAAQSASGKGDHDRAVGYARECLAIARTLRSESSHGTARAAPPPIGLAASDLAACAIAGGPPLFQDAEREIDLAIAICRAAANHQSDPLNLAYCLHAKAQILLENGKLSDLQPIFEEGARLLIDGRTGVLEAEFPVVRRYAVTTTAWARAAQDHPDIAVSQAALRLASRFVEHIFGIRAAGGQPAFQRAQLQLCESQLAIRLGTPREGAAPAAKAVAMLRTRLQREPDRLSLVLQTAAALQQARKFAEFPEAGWSEQDQGALLARLLQQLAARSAELSPEQRQTWDSLR
jgi:tetratricopeptide (TPR) repeat protein